MMCPFYQGVSGCWAALTLRYQSFTLHQRVHSRPYEVRFPLGSLRNGLKTAGVFLVVELIFDDAQQSLVELQQCLDLALVLGV